METQNREICCCGARCWTLVIGWLTLTICGIGLIAIVINIVEEGDGFRPDYGLLVFRIVIQILLSTGLIAAVYKEQHKMLQAWCVLTGIGLVVGVFQIFRAIIAEETTMVIVTVVECIITGFFIWVVNVHRKEILANQNTGTTVKFGKGTGTTGPRLV